jgi:hypothetical protein
MLKSFNTIIEMRESYIKVKIRLVRKKKGALYFQENKICFFLRVENETGLSSMINNLIFFLMSSSI